MSGDLIYDKLTPEDWLYIREQSLLLAAAVMRTLDGGLEAESFDNNATIDNIAYAFDAALRRMGYDDNTFPGNQEAYPSKWESIQVTRYIWELFQ